VINERSRASIEVADELALGLGGVFNFNNVNKYSSVAILRGEIE
jgi:hypothetical protein